MTVVAPSQRLAPYVRRFTIVESAEGMTRALLPEHGLVVGVRFAGEASLLDSTNGERASRIPDLTLTGIVGSVRHMRTSAGGGVVLAMFHEAGAAQLIAEPLHQLFGQTRALDDLIPRAALARLQQRIVEAADHPARIALFEQFLLERLRPDPVDPLVSAAIAQIRRARGSLRIAELAGQLGISQDPLEKRFRRTVGASPKHLASLIRMSQVVDAHRRSVADPKRPPPAWSRLAIEAGYFDQSHFIREFRSLTGQSPSQFFRSGSFCGAPPAPAVRTGSPEARYAFGG